MYREGMLKGSEVSKDSYHSPVKNNFKKQLKIYKLSQIDRGQSTFKGGSSFTINNMLRQTVTMED